MTMALIERFRKYVNDHPDIPYRVIDRRAKLYLGQTATIVQGRITNPSRRTVDRIQRFLDGTKVRVTEFRHPAHPMAKIEYVRVPNARVPHLSRRDYFAAAAMQGITSLGFFSSVIYAIILTIQNKTIEQAALEYADDLIAELDK